jgi:hypothetical protein
MSIKYPYGGFVQGIPAVHVENGQKTGGQDRKGANMPDPMNLDMATQDARDYLSGKARIWGGLRQKRMKDYVYAEDASITNGSSGRIDLAIDADAHFLVEGVQIVSSLQTSSDDLFTVQISDSTYSQTWSNAAVPVRDAAGLGTSVKRFHYPNILAPTGTLTFSITNNTGSTAQFYVAAYGRKVYDVNAQERAFLMKRMWYQYVMTVASIAGSTNAQKTQLQIFNESDFLWRRTLSWELHKAVYTASGGAVSNEINLTFRDTSTGMNYFSKKLSGRLLVGALRSIQQNGATAYVAGDTFEWSMPQMVRRNAILEGEFDNLATSATGQFRLIFEGARIFT